MSSVRADLRRWWRRTARYRPASATGWVVAVTIAVYVAQLLSRGVVQDLLALHPYDVLPRTGAPFEPWRLLTTALVHQPVGPGGGIVGLAHIGFNLYALVLFGGSLENVMGARRILAIYSLSVLGGSVAIVAAALVGLVDVRTEVIGASGGVFGVLGAVVVVPRRLGVDVRALLAMIAINFALPFFVGRIAWEAHLGGLAVGAATGALFIANRGPRRNRRAWVGAALVAAVLVLLVAGPALTVP